jgi:flagellar hook-associated protein FlgK
MKSKIIIAITLVLALSTLAIASPALAQNKRATSTAARITNLQNRGNQEIDKRITSLNNLLSRIQ